MKFAAIKHGYGRRAAILVTSVCVLLVATDLVLRSTWMQGAVRDQLRSMVLRTTGASYTCGIGEVRIDPLFGDLSISDIALEPDTSLLDSLRQGRGRFLLSAQAASLSIHGLSFWRLLLWGEVHVTSVNVEAPVVRYTYASKRGAQALSGAENGTAVRTPDLLSIGELVISDAGGTVVDLAERSSELTVGRMNVHARELKIVRPELGEPLIWTVGGAQLDVRDIAAELPPLYDLSIARLGFRHPQGIAFIDSLRYAPRVERSTTHRLLQESATVYALDVTTITLARVDLYKALAEQRIEMGCLTAEGAVVDVFLDKSMPDALSRTIPLPVSALRNLPFGLRVDTLRLLHAEVTYSERSKVENGYGSVQLTSVEATIVNVSNDTLLASSGVSMHGDVRARLFDVGELHGVYEARLDSRKDAFTLDVDLRDMPLSAANGMSENLIMLKADSGWISSLKMRMNADNDSAEGRFTLRYSDAWLRILNVDGGKRRLLTGLTNAAVHHDSNDRPADERTVLLRIGRKQDRGFFNFIWCYTREGLTHTLLPEALADIQGGMMRRKEKARNEDQRQRRAREGP